MLDESSLGLSDLEIGSWLDLPSGVKGFGLSPPFSWTTLVSV